MKKAVNWICVLSFLTVCALVLLFFAPLTETDGSLTYLEWDSGAVVAADGDVTPIDLQSAQPGLPEGAAYRFTAVLPERGETMYLVMDTTGAAFSLTLDGAPLYDAASAQQSSATVTLPPGGGESLALEISSGGVMNIFPPLIRLTGDPTYQADAMSYANYYAIPAGAMALTLVLLCGLFLLGVSEGRPHWKELLLIFAAAELTVYPLAVGFGTYFFPAALLGVLAWRGWALLCVLALAAYLALHRSRGFWLAWALMAGCSLAALLACWGVSALAGGYLARFMSMLLQEIGSGYYENLVYWLTSWLVLVCTVLSAWELVRYIAAARSEARAMALKNQLMMDNYRAIESRLRENAARQHEFNHRLAAMDAMLRRRDLEGLERSLSSWRSDGAGADRLRYTGNAAVNAIMQDAAVRAEAAGVAFRASAQVPPELPLPEEDVCTLLMNMLDNAVEGASLAQGEGERYIRFHVKAAGGFMAVLCENTFDGRVDTDARGAPRTRKSGDEPHGFGLTQMRAVAEKYGSILDVSWTDTLFTVQTALKLPEKK